MVNIKNDNEVLISELIITNNDLIEKVERFDNIMHDLRELTEDHRIMSNIITCSKDC